MASSISSLAGLIKPDMFNSGFNVQEPMSVADAAKKYGWYNGASKNLAGGLKPMAISSIGV